MAVAQSPTGLCVVRRQAWLRKNKDKRFTVLYEDGLAWFTDDPVNGGKVKHTIDLANYTVSEAPDVGEGAFRLVPVQPKRKGRAKEYVFFSKNTSEIQGWKDDIDDVRKKRLSSVIYGAKGGWLERKGRQRFFLLRDQCLTWFKDDQHPALPAKFMMEVATQGRVRLSKSTVVYASSKNKFTFALRVFSERQADPSSQSGNLPGSESDSSIFGSFGEGETADSPTASSGSGSFQDIVCKADTIEDLQSWVRNLQRVINDIASRENEGSGGGALSESPAASGTRGGVGAGGNRSFVVDGGSRSAAPPGTTFQPRTLGTSANSASSPALLPDPRLPTAASVADERKFNSDPGFAAIFGAANVDGGKAAREDDYGGLPPLETLDLTSARELPAGMSALQMPSAFGVSGFTEMPLSLAAQHQQEQQRQQLDRVESDLNGGDENDYGSLPPADVSSPGAEHSTRFPGSGFPALNSGASSGYRHTPETICSGQTALAEENDYDGLPVPASIASRLPTVRQDGQSSDSPIYAEDDDYGALPVSASVAPLPTVRQDGQSAKESDYGGLPSFSDNTPAAYVCAVPKQTSTSQFVEQRAGQPSNIPALHVRNPGRGPSAALPEYEEINPMQLANAYRQGSKLPVLPPQLSRQNPTPTQQPKNALSAEVSDEGEYSVIDPEQLAHAYRS